MPSVRKGESEKAFVKRCIPIVLKEGTAKDGEQAAAICHSMYREAKKAKASTSLNPGSPELGSSSRESAWSAHRKPSPPLPQIPSTFYMDASLDIMASEGDDDSLPKILLKANSGIPMRLDGFFDPVIIDLDGAKFDRKVTPIIADHDPSRRIGHTIRQSIIPVGKAAKYGSEEIQGPMIVAMGVQSSTMGIAQGIIADAKAGFPFQVSVGADIVPGEAYFVPEGEKAKINGKTWKGPLIVAKKTIIRELTIAVLGADQGTSATLAASARPTIKLKTREVIMDFQAFVRSLGLDPETLSEDQTAKLQAHWQSTKPPADPPPVPARKPKPDEDDDDDPPVESRADLDIKASREKRAAEESRVDQIRATAARFEGQGLKEMEIDGKKIPVAQAKVHAIEKGWTPEKWELACFHSDIEAGSPNRAPAIHTKDQQINMECMSASILRYCGVEDSGVNKYTGKKHGIQAMFKAEILEESHRPQHRFHGSVSELFRAQVEAAGHYCPRGGDLQAAAVRAWTEIHTLPPIQASGFSNLNITHLMEDVMHKAMLESFTAREGVWSRICGRRPVNDFRTHYLYRLDHSGHFSKVDTTGELKHISVTDEKHQIAAETYGCMLTIDRKDRINDDLGVVVAKAQGIGALGAIAIEKTVFAVLFGNVDSNGNAFFSIANGNLIAATLGIAGLSTAKQVFRDQVVNGSPVNIAPALLLVGTPLEVTADRLYQQTRFAGTRGPDNFEDNPHAGDYVPVVSPYLSNTACLDLDGSAFTGQSNTLWYLLASPSIPQGSAIAIAFLNGRETPYVDTEETQFNIPEGLQVRAYLDWGVALHVPEAAVRSTGTGGSLSGSGS